MYKKTIFLLAAFVLPLLAAPLPGNEVISPQDIAQRHEGSSLSDVLDEISRREPAVETIPVEAQADVDIEKQYEDLAVGDDPEDGTNIERRGRIGTNPINKRGRIGTHPIAKRGRIGTGPIATSIIATRGRIGTSPIGTRGRIGTGPIATRGRIGDGPIGKRSLFQRALEAVFG